MRIYACADYRAMSRRAASIIAAQVVLKPDCVLGLATGSTPVGAYEQLVKWYQQGDLSFAQTRSVNLDEYQGLAPTHDQSYRYFMQQNLFNHIDIVPENTHVLNGLAEDPAAECAAYDQMIRDLGGVDLQLLGTHVVTLSERTIDANQRFFASRDDVPRHALSMGIKSIMSARRILIVVSGADKAEALCQAVSGPVTNQVPASVLQLHPDVTLVADEAALSKLRQAGAVL